MPAKIHIVAGVRSGAAIWIDKPVFRIGSHPDSDVCIPSAEIAEHAATLEFRQGVYAVYNRAKVLIRIDGLVVAPGKFGVWSHSGRLDLGDSTILQLESIGDGSPKPVEVSYEAPPFDEDTPLSTVVSETATQAEGSSNSSLKTLGQVVVIIFSCLVVAAMIYHEFLKPPASAQSANAPNISLLLDNLRAAVDESSGGERRLFESQLKQLKLAEFSRMRGDLETSRRIFETLRSELQGREDHLDEKSKQLQSEFLKHVLYRLSE